MTKKSAIGIGLLAFILLILAACASFYPDWLWFENLGFSPIFWTMILSKVGLGSVIWVIFMFIMILNFLVAKRIKPASEPVAAPKDGPGTLFGLPQSGKARNIILLCFFLVASYVVASKGAYRWDMVLLYLYQQPFGTTDPIFQRDMGFYVFSLPFYMFMQNGLLIFFFIAGLVAGWWYLKEGALEGIDQIMQAEGMPASMPKIDMTPKARKHITLIGGVIALLLAWGYYLKTFGLLYSTQGAAFGAGYTDVHVRILSYRILTIVSVGFAVVLFMDLFKPRKKFIFICGGIWLATVLLFWNVLPILVQKFLVKPNELTKESPYISYNIKHTRDAYNLNRIKEVDFQVKEKLTPKDLKENDVTIQNIRIWDERPLLQTYRQIQAIRLYYDFNNVDVDRYLINNKYRQVMLASRELIIDQLPRQAKTWVNRHLIYTHGYGVASSSVNEVTGEGLPRLLIKDLPPSFEPDLKIERPEIYYGEKTKDYVLVETKAKEFDYPKGDKNVYATYQGKGGVPINSFFRRILFAFEFFDPQILFTNYLSPESRIMYNRRINVRVGVISPFLDYDSDPYVVVSDGKLFWVQDAYTTSNMYPYSRRSYNHLNNKPLNYIRNSVKVTIDAYNGDVSYYIMDEKDPILKTYGRIFPDLLKPFSEMPEDLKRHIRYPRDLFDIQVDTYRTYHMDDVQVFYNQEDLWEVPDELYGDARQAMKPYYIILKLPEAEKEEFLLMIPFTPSKKDNMIGWMAARSDLPNYGNLLVYKLPKDKLVYGPMQVEARVDQQTEISRELSLWGQRGSRVIRGNLLAIPLGDSFIYVEPVYLEAKQEEAEQMGASQPQQPKGFGKSDRKGSQAVSGRDKSKSASLPELKRVIVAIGNRVIMAENLDRALNMALGAVPIPKELPSPVKASAALPGENLGRLALEHYIKAKEHLRRGNWAGYGKALENLEKILTKMSKQKVEGKGK